jgi:hypothetical protein
MPSSQPTPPELPASALVYRIRTNLETRRPTSGFDSCVVAVPSGIYVNGSKIIRVRVLNAALRQLSEQMASNIGERLHHADWIITGDAELVQRIILTHDCERCQAAAVQAAGRMAERPDSEMLAGILYWAG